MIDGPPQDEVSPRNRGQSGLPLIPFPQDVGVVVGAGMDPEGQRVQVRTCLCFVFFFSPFHDNFLRILLFSLAGDKRIGSL